MGEFCPNQLDPPPPPLEVFRKFIHPSVINIPHHFCERSRPQVPTQIQVKKDVYCLSQYFTELSLVDYNLAGMKV